MVLTAEAYFRRFRSFNIRLFLLERLYLGKGLLAAARNWKPFSEMYLLLSGAF